MTIKPMTQLEAVNVCLTNLGEEPVNTLTGTIPLDASQALVTVNEVSTEVQRRGWYFNTEYHTLTPDSQGFIYLPNNTLRVRTDETSRDTPVVQRGDRLFNMTPYFHGFVFTSPVKLCLVMGLPFEDLPQSARSYITHRAARVFQIRQLGDAMSAQEDQKDEQMAYIDLFQEQMRAEPVTLKSAFSVASSISQRPLMTVNV